MRPREDRSGPPAVAALEGRRSRFREHARAAFLQGAEEHSLATFGRPLTRDELERVLKRYPGDP